MSNRHNRVPYTKPDLNLHSQVKPKSNLVKLGKTLECGLHDLIRTKPTWPQFTRFRRSLSGPSSHTIQLSLIETLFLC
jgi:hypothetical protein